MKANELLLWLSMRRQGSWQQFKSAVEELYSPEEATPEEGSPTNEEADQSDAFPLYQRLRRSLESLGHVEFFAHGCENGWRVAPPVLAFWNQSGVSTGVLCGARSTRLLGRVSQVAELVDVAIEAQEGGPDVLRFSTADQSALDQAIQAVGLIPQRDAPLTILGALPTVDEYVRRRASVDLPFGAEAVHKFSVPDLAWHPSEREGALRAQESVFRFIVRHRVFYFVCSRGRAHRVPGEVGKYFMLSRQRVRVLQYNPKTKELFTPAICRAPLLVERALVTCTGKLPGFDPQNKVLTCKGVPEAVARLVFQLLGQGAP